MEANVSTPPDSNPVHQPDDPVHQNHTPFLDNLLHEQQSHLTSFHMPGHKHRLEPSAALAEYWGANLFHADLVEINGSVDYLHAPKGSLLQAQALAAQAFGADHTFFLINGSTVGNQAAILSAVRQDQKIIMPRTSHRSVYGGLVLSGAVPLYIEPLYHPQVGFPMAVDPLRIKSLLEAHTGVAAVHITSPNYYGYISDVAAIAQLAHEHGALLIVDEAHGSHFAFHPDLPISAVHLGADMIVQSTHKTLTALTQCSMLHCNDARVNLSRVAQVLTMLQSSSPSSILLASLDGARIQMAVHGQHLLDCTLQLAYEARSQIRQIAGLWCYGEDLVGDYGIYGFDPTKLLIRVTDLGLTGFQAAYFLHTECLVDVEFVDLKHIIFSITLADTQQSLQTLVYALQRLASQGSDTKIVEVDPPTGLPQAVMSVRDGYFAQSKTVQIDDSLGRICAENIIPYPPGIPLLVPGEVIEQPMIDYIKHLVNNGTNVVGPEDRMLQTIRVVATG